MIIRFFIIGVIFLVTLSKGQSPNQNRQNCKEQKYCNKAYCQIEFYKKFCPKTCGACTSSWVDPTLCDDLNCEHGCEVLSDDEIVCTCRSSYKLHQNGYSCEDIDECLSSPCENGLVCSNTIGSYICSNNRQCLTGKTNYYKRENCCEISENTCGQNRKTGLPGSLPTPDIDPARGDWPWIATVVINERRYLGVLISKDWVLLPAHSFRDGDEDIIVEVGDNGSEQRSAGGFQSIDVDEVFIHPEYDFPNNDIALIRLYSRATTSGWVYPICLPNGEAPSDKTTCWLNGLEMKITEKDLKFSIAYKNVTITSPDPCKKILQKFGVDEDQLHGTICGSFGFKDSIECPGEIGGALVCQRCSSCDWYIFGLAFFGDICTNPENLSHILFTSINRFESWIEKTTETPININSRCSDDSDEVEGSFEAWGAWSSCSSSCDGGSQTRHRSCDGERCVGRRKQARRCNTKKCSNWSEWGPWGVCSVTCGDGIIKRVRSCPGGSERCPGRLSEVKKCQQRCSKWSEFAPWTSCTKTCGGGRKEKRRRCLDGEIGDPGCPAGREVVSMICGIEDCESWSSWSSWSLCGERCDSKKQKTRDCLRGRIGDPGCRGSWKLDEFCYPDVCESLYPWSEWGSCSVSCGSGQQKSVQRCSSMSSCIVATKIRSCSINSCSSSDWLTWSTWSDCDEICGKGFRKRNRRCRSGRFCVGNDLEEESCQGAVCDDDSCFHLNNLNPINFCINQISKCSSSTTIRSLCSRTCCQYDKTLEEGVCMDHPGWASLCTSFPFLCSKFDIVKTVCKKTCKIC